MKRKPSPRARKPAIAKGDSRGAFFDLFEADEAEVDKTMEVAKAVMEKAPEPVLRLSVPLKVDARSGDNWEAAH